MQLITKRLATVLLVAGLAGLSSSAYALTGIATTKSTNIMNSVYDYAASEGARDLIERADEALNALTYTIHDMDTHQIWDDNDGVYEVDCSGYVGHLLEDAVPSAYDELGDWAGTSRPRSGDFYAFFKTMSKGGTRGRWRRPEKVSYLSPGDVLVWRYEVDPGTGSTGHTMVVVSEAVKDSSRGPNIYRMRVTDSARSGHTNDNRGTNGSGVGAGEILVKTDSNGQPIQYAWSVTGPFHSDIVIAMGRPRY